MCVVNQSSILSGFKAFTSIRSATVDKEPHPLTPGLADKQAVGFNDLLVRMLLTHNEMLREALPLPPAPSLLKPYLPTSEDSISLPWAHRFLVCDTTLYKPVFFMQGLYFLYYSSYWFLSALF